MVTHALHAIVSCAVLLPQHRRSYLSLLGRASLLLLY